MKLLVDIGNTRIKWAYDDGQALVAAGNVVHRGQPVNEAVRFAEGLELVPDAAFAVNVAGPALAKALTSALHNRFGIELINVPTTGRAGEVVNGYRATGQLGVDRWAAIVGAWQICRQSVCVVDAGTAVTIDVVAADGQHQGGIIIPGVDLMRASLDRDTSDIREFAAHGEGPAAEAGWYGRDTLAAVNRGALFVLQATIDRAVSEMGAGGQLPVVMITGGDADLVIPLLGYPVQHRPLLVLDGLRYLVAGLRDA